MTERQSKATQERHERILNELVKMPGNDLCADCGTKSKKKKRVYKHQATFAKDSLIDPRWASYSLGIFLCIRCAGIHRKMGTHISKIKSITMDQWTVEQIDVRETKRNHALINCAI